MPPLIKFLTMPLTRSKCFSVSLLKISTSAIRHANKFVRYDSVKRNEFCTHVGREHVPKSVGCPVQGDPAEEVDDQYDVRERGGEV